MKTYTYKELKEMSYEEREEYNVILETIRFMLGFKWSGEVAEYKEELENAHDKESIDQVQLCLLGVKASEIERILTEFFKEKTLDEVCKILYKIA